jgi:signal transduction histidine kinase
MNDVVALAEIAQLLQATDQSRARVLRALEHLGTIVPYDHCRLVIDRPEGAETFAVPDAVVEEERVSHLDALLRGHVPEVRASATRAHLALPLTVGDADGVILVERQGAPYDENALALLSVVSAQLATYAAYCHAIEQLRAQVAAVEAAQAFQELLIGIVSHDLRNPLSAIAAGTALLSKRVHEPSQLALLVRIHHSGQRATRIIDDLLDLTRARTSGALHIAAVESDLTAIARDLVAEMQLAHDDRELNLVASETVRAQFDPHRLAQALGNLVANALQHGAAHTPVEVSIAATDSEISVAVRNEGVPIPPELLPRLFDPYKRGAAPARYGQRPRGLGLGLYIVDQIAKAHGGRVTVTSTAEAGTRFVLTLPR